MVQLLALLLIPFLPPEPPAVESLPRPREFFEFTVQGSWTDRGEGGEFGVANVLVMARKGLLETPETTVIRRFAAADFPVVDHRFEEELTQWTNDFGCRPYSYFAFKPEFNWLKQLWELSSRELSAPRPRDIQAPAAPSNDGSQEAPSQFDLIKTRIDFEERLERLCDFGRMKDEPWLDRCRSSAQLQPDARKIDDPRLRSVIESQLRLASIFNAERIYSGTWAARWFPNPAIQPPDWRHSVSNLHFIW
jgi:hypothetical protein